jgi:diguanylate cyclase (GGDEF)-like protein
VTSVEPGFHPLQRVVRRLSKISPHRQIQLLFAISFVTVAVMVAAVIGSLTPTQNSLESSNQSLVPALRQLDRAREAYNSGSIALPLTLSSDPAERTKGINQLTEAHSVGESAYREFQRKSLSLPGQQDLERRIAADRKGALESGAAFLGEPVATADALAVVARFTSALLIDLNHLKALYQTKVLRSLADAGAKVDSTRREILVISGGALVILLIAFGVAIRSARSREERLKLLDQALHDDSERNELEARLQRSLEMAHDEDAVYSLVGRALSINVPGLSTQLLVADSSRAHFRAAAVTNEREGSGCPVPSPSECPAATWGQTQTWPSSTALDACPYLQDRPSGDCSAACVPVSIGGNTVGVVHVTAPDGEQPTEPTVARVELVARKVGERVGMLRAFRRSETQAHTDPLTGLMNRRSLEEQVRSITENGLTYVVVYADLDHFKQLNDVHGHDAGDQALRLFAGVMRDTVRPADLTARYGGEEFVVVFPDTQISDAYSVINRLREQLAHAQERSSSPRFTASFGITAARPEDTFSQTLEIADAALLKAKGSGRDRIIIGGTESSPDDAVVAVTPGEITRSELTETK